MGEGARKRRFAVGAEVQGDGTTEVRVWAPRRRTVSVAIEGDARRPLALEPEANGYFGPRGWARRRDALSVSSGR